MGKDRWAYKPKEDMVVSEIYQKEVLATVTRHVKRLMDDNLTGTMSIDFKAGGVTYIDISISPTYLPETVLDARGRGIDKMSVDMLLCANCNWGKHINKGICPHKDVNCQIL